MIVCLVMGLPVELLFGDSNCERLSARVIIQLRAKPRESSGSNWAQTCCGFQRCEWPDGGEEDHRKAGVECRGGTIGGDVGRKLCECSRVADRGGPVAPRGAARHD